jgi:hypothetical protein
MRIANKARVIVKKMLPVLARFHPYNWKDAERWTYPQTWALSHRIAPRWNKRLKKQNIFQRTLRREILERLCWHVTGHEISRTEWGYGGGKFVDRHCRWCDAVLKIPKNEDEPPNDTLKGLADQLGFSE